MSNTEIEIEIDGRPLKVAASQTVMQAADAAGIYIPRFCYHKHLSIAANCRMCLVEVEKSPKTLPACATPVTSGMKVYTTSQKTREAQRAVMEFLLINHPLDCPICDQGGECELQDLAMGYGSGHSAYEESKRAVGTLALGPLIATEMTRCIHCTRCVRFGDEVAGLRELGVTYRGEHTEIGTYVQQAIQSEVSGNMIDLCPVGALTAKPSRFTTRPWELTQSVSISPHDCIGSHLALHTLRGEIMRVAARENAAINETWIADRDRFSYTGLYHPHRLKRPMAKMDGEWQDIEWEAALTLAAQKIRDVLGEFGADKLGALASPQSTLEELYLLQKLVRGLDSPHIDHRLRESDTRDQAAMAAFPGFQLRLTELEQCDAILLIGSHLQKEQPLLSLRVRKAALKGAAILALNPMDYVFHFPITAKKIAAPHLLIDELSALVSAFEAQDTAHSLVKALLGKKKVCLLIGALALHHPEAAVIRSLACQLAALSGAAINFMTDGPNTAGAWLAGAVPHRQAGGKAINQPGLSAYDMLAKPRKAYLLLNVEPDLDCAHAKQAQEALKQAACVIALSLYRNPVLEAHADVILPMAPFTETSGTFVSAEGEWQSFTGAAKPYHASRPAWKILQALANFLQLTGFDYEDSAAIKHEAAALARHAAVHSPQSSYEKKGKTSALSRIGEIPIYAADSLVRHAQPLQEAQSLMEGDLAAVRLHPVTAKRLGLQAAELAVVKQGTAQVTLPVMLDERVAPEAAWVPGATALASELGDLLGEIEIEKA